MLPLYRDPDVLDTWFSSGLWPIGTLGWPEDTEAAQKILPHRRSDHRAGHPLFLGRAHDDDAAGRGRCRTRSTPSICTSLSATRHGKKMSKTTGNVIDPLEIIDRYGADALRFSNASMAAIGGVLKLSEDRIKGYRNFTTKLWNAARFAEMNGAYSGGVKTHKPVHGAGSKRHKRPSRQGSKRTKLGQQMDRGRGRPSPRSHGRCGAERLPVQRRRERALRLCLGHSLRLVSGVLQTTSSRPKTLKLLKKPGPPWPGSLTSV